MSGNQSAKDEKKSSRFLILVVSDNPTWKLSAYEIAKGCLAQEAWVFRENSKYPGVFARGDRVIVYVGGHGEHRQCFIASGTVSDAVLMMEANVCGLKFSRKLPLKDIQYFSPPVSILSIKDQLDFITLKNNPNWAICLMKAARTISEKDFSFIETQAFHRLS